MRVVHVFFLLLSLTIVSRLIELQLVRGADYREVAQSQHYGKVTLPARRGEILGIDSKTGETSIFATNSTLDLVYVDPVVTNPDKRPSDASEVARTLSQILLTPDFHDACSHGQDACPRELQKFYQAAFDPLMQHKLRDSGSLLEPLAPGQVIPPSVLQLPSLVQARDAFFEDILRRIREKYVTFALLKEDVTKAQMKAVAALGLPGVQIEEESHLVWANPQEINQSLLDAFARSLAPVLEADPEVLRKAMRSRSLRYVPIMSKIPQSLSLRLLEAKSVSAKAALDESKRQGNGGELQYPLRGIALIAEHWRLYPDTTIASQVVGFLNTRQQAQYGIERAFHSQLRGQEGSINTVSDPNGGEILNSSQTISDPKDGDTIVLALDRSIQKEVERIMADAIERYKADSGQAIVMDPFTGRILAMVNAPLFNSNDYAEVYEREAIDINADHQKQIVVEIHHPKTNARIVRAYIDQIFTASGRLMLTDKTRSALQELENLYDLDELTRYYLYISETIRREIFPTDKPNIWLKYKNNLGVGAYLNRTVQEMYEPGSVLKPITMAVALDQGEVRPEDTYDDFGLLVIPDDPLHPIGNNDGKHYGRVTMTQCLEFSINTCMADVAFRLGSRLFYSALDRFGFGHITGIELEDELAGQLRHWRGLPRHDLASISFGQAISATPLQVITAWSALANGGKLMRPILIDRIVHPDGTVQKFEPRMIDQVITPGTSETITAMLASSAAKGFARAGKVPGYRMAGKTGTSQISRPGGGYETGTGSTVATFAGYAPIHHPRFVVLVKVDRPKNQIHGATVAAPAFKEIAAFLFRYYGIPPDER